MAGAQAFEVEHVGSHSVAGDHFAGRITREECYPRVRGQWRGTPCIVEMEANRYEHSGGWSEWRIFARDVRRIVATHRSMAACDAFTDTARQRLGEQARPLVEAWLASDAYAPSRRRAFASYVARSIRDGSSRYSVDRLRELIAAVRHELDPVAADQLDTAVDHLYGLDVALTEATK